MYVVLYAKHPRYLLDFQENWIFEKQSNIRLYENPFSGRRVVPCRIIDRRTDKQTNMAQVRVSFRRFANEPKYLRYYPNNFPLSNVLQIVQVHQQSGSKQCRRAPFRWQNFLDTVLLRRTWVFVTCL